MLKPRFLSLLVGILSAGDTCRLILSGAIVALVMVATVVPAPADSQDPDPQKKFEQMTLEELLQMKVTSVSKKEERSFKVPAAVFVVTNEDIRRSGARNVADALRLVPGVHIAQIDSNKWAIGVRGFNNRFNYYVLVLIDGRSVYSPVFSGVYWSLQDLLLEDVQRIEVIRGPGATQWGSNAVNGVINIITKNSRDTQGGYAEVGGGTIERGFGAVRHGGEIGANASYRVYGKAASRGNLEAILPLAPDDNWWSSRGGFRLDWNMSKRDTLMAQADILGGVYGGNTQVPELTPPYMSFLSPRNDFTSGSGMARWTRRFSDKSATSLQFYFDRTTFEEPIGTMKWGAFDLEFQHNWTPTPRHSLGWTLGARFASTDLDPWVTSMEVTRERSFEVYSFSVQDQIAVAPDRFSLTLGARFEHHGLTGANVQPTFRLAWTPDDQNTLWAAASRAVRTPGTAESDASLFLGRVVQVDPTNPMMPPIMAGLAGNPNLEEEELIAYEAGYRFQANRYFSIDIAGYANRYQRINVAFPEQPYPVFSPSMHLRLPLRVTNGMDGESYGAEVAAYLSPSTFSKIGLSYTYIDVELETAGIDLAASHQPSHQFGAHGSIDLPKGFKLDSALYFVNRVPSYQIDRYTRIDCRLAWAATEAIELSVVGQNLAQDEHQEFGSILWELPTAIPRSVYGMLAWRF